jgi:hypothetical protein
MSFRIRKLMNSEFKPKLISCITNSCELFAFQLSFDDQNSYFVNELKLIITLN